MVGSSAEPLCCILVQPILHVNARDLVRHLAPLPVTFVVLPALNLCTSEGTSSGMLRTDYFGGTRLALHVPSSS